MFKNLQNNRNALGLLFMLPAAIVLVMFLTYPLGLGVWLGFTDTKIGRGGSGSVLRITSTCLAMM